MFFLYCKIPVYLYIYIYIIFNLFCFNYLINKRVFFEKRITIIIMTQTIFNK